jgi:hypothetical protein
VTVQPVEQRDRGPAPAPRGASLLTETVDRSRGRIRASGHLTSLGADLLSGTADRLRESGHVRVVLDLRDVQAADDEGMDILRSLEASFAAAGGQLVFRPALSR